MSKPTVGFVGVGLMGHGMAKNLVSKGWPISVGKRGIVELRVTVFIA